MMYGNRLAQSLVGGHLFSFFLVLLSLKYSDFMIPLLQSVAQFIYFTPKCLIVHLLCAKHHLGY